MIRIPVESSDIVSIGYDEPSRLLEVEFNGGRVYQYRNVERDIHDQLMRADSHGQYFDTFIHGRYRFDRIDARKTQHTSDALLFATGNNRKFRDLQKICEQYGIPLEQVAISIDEIQSQDPEEIALKKAKAAYKITDRPVVVTDTYWSILALRGFPGAYMADVNTWLQAEDFLRMMEGKTDRTVVCTDTLVYYDGSRAKTFVDTTTSFMVTEPKGKGYAHIDRITADAGDSRTIAEIEDAGGRPNPEVFFAEWTKFAKWFSLQRRIGKA